MRHAPGEDLRRHLHEAPFAAVILAGGYVEAGDAGRHHVRPGEVLLHRAYESHLDRFDHAGAEVLVLPLTGWGRGAGLGAVADPDLLARLAERDVRQASAALHEMLEPAVSVATDWPDLLAQALQEDPSLRLCEWAEAMGLHLGSLSRGFRQLYGLTPAGFRSVQRAHRAVEEIFATDMPLSAIAHACGFADQAHMSRAVLQLTAHSPAALRRVGRQAQSAPA